MTVYTPVWVCAFVDNRWRRPNGVVGVVGGGNKGRTGEEDGFGKAMGATERRTVAIVDEWFYTRLWSLFELCLTLAHHQKTIGGGGGGKGTNGSETNHKTSFTWAVSPTHLQTPPSWHRRAT